MYTDRTPFALLAVIAVIPLACNVACSSDLSQPSSAGSGATSAGPTTSSASASSATSSSGGGTAIATASSGEGGATVAGSGGGSSGGGGQGDQAPTALLCVGCDRAIKESVRFPEADHPQINPAWLCTDNADEPLT